MAYSFGVALPARQWQMPPLPRRRVRSLKQEDAERMERDFWRLFDLEKLAGDGRPGGPGGQPIG